MAALAPIAVAMPFAAAALLAVAAARLSRTAAAWLAALALALGLLAVLALAPAVFDGQVPAWRRDWLPALGLALGFRVDGLAWVFALLICGIGLLIVLYAAYYLHAHDPAPRFYAYLMLFAGAMLGVVLADNLLLLAIFWELTSLSSFLLIGYWRERAESRQGARMALAITGGGGLALLAGLLLLGEIAGSYELQQVLAAGDRIRAHPLYLPALVLVLLGAFAKSAQFPLHFWLPQAMAAPTPVSAYLHSATMVKAGVFLLARLYPALGGSEAWFWIVVPVGLATLVIGAYIAIFQHDLKGLLAYSTISHLGLITLLFGLNSALAVVAGVFHILNHATFKASLFMAAGIIDHEAGTRDMRKLNGLWSLMPVTGALGMVAAAAMAGVPLANGFLSKEMFFAETLAADHAGALRWLLPAGALIAGIFSVAYSTRFIHDVFFNGAPVGLPKTPHEPPRFMRVPVELLVVLCVVVGVLPAATVGPLLAVAAQAALFGGPHAPLPDYKLALWHGWNAPLAMSVAALAGGLALYFGLQRFIDLHRVARLPLWVRTGGREIFLAIVDVKLAAARALTATIQNGNLQRYLLLLVLMALAAGALPWLRASATGLPAPRLTEADPAFAAVWLLGVAAAVAATLAYRRRLIALLLVGAVGLAVSLAFVYLSAPDLALTQLLVEMVTVILMMLALHWLPSESAPEGARGRAVRDALFALAAGAGIAALAYAAMTREPRSIAQFFLDRAVPEGGGGNVVNVILVDFRGYDTLGEITVLGIAGLIIHALLAGYTAQARHAGPVDYAAGRSLLLQLASRLLLPLAILLSLYLFLRGHNQPGGGFIAGLVLALALVLLYVAHGQQWVDARLRTDWRVWIAAGLLAAAGCGAASLLFGAPFLTSTYVYLPLPIIGAVPLASALVFDLGVYLTVAGATMAALVSIGRIRREPR